VATPLATEILKSYIKTAAFRQSYEQFSRAFYKMASCCSNEAFV